jgi:beta-phosphoglucomutase family hydrolase
MLGLPDHVRACLFDMDGVLTRTATVHAAAWKTMFDEFLRAWAEKTGEPFVPFDPVADYDRYVDGRRRLDGTRTFLTARGIEIPEGSPQDPADALTLHGLGERKNQLLLSLLATEGVDVFNGSVRFVRAVRDAGLRTAVVSSSANTARILDAAKIADLFDARIDGVTARRRHLKVKPAPDMYLAGAEALDVRPSETAVFEDALPEYRAARAGGFTPVIGVDRTGQAEALGGNGADIVVTDLAELMEA